jgi:hypothetical protein
MEHLAATAPDVFGALLYLPHADLADLRFNLRTGHLDARPFPRGTACSLAIPLSHKDDLLDEVPDTGTSQKDTKGKYGI